MKRALSTIALLVSFSGCENTCEPGSVRVESGVARNTASNSTPDPLRVAIELGDCSSTHFPTPVVIARNSTGDTLGKIYSKSLHAGHVDLEIDLGYDAPRGWLDVELKFPAVSRFFRAYHSNPLRSLEKLGEVDFMCFPPLALNSDAIICNTPKPDGGPSIIEASPIARSISLDGRLWSTPQGALLTTENGIGWFPDIPLTGWVPARQLPGEVLHVAATADAVYVLQPGTLRALSSDLQTELTSVATQISDEPAYVLSSAEHIFVAGAGNFEVFRWQSGSLVAENTGATLGELHGAAPDELWTCDNDLIRRYKPQSNELVLTGTFQQFGRCHSRRGFQRPSILASKNTFLACPWADGDSLKMVELDLGAGNFGACQDDVLIYMAWRYTSTLFKPR